MAYMQETFIIFFCPWLKQANYMWYFSVCNWKGNQLKVGAYIWWFWKSTCLGNTYILGEQQEFYE
jgi:hypothetical protein